MSIINNRFLSLTNRALTQKKVQKEAEAKAQLQKQQAEEAEAKQPQAPQKEQIENQTQQQKQLSSNINDDLLLTYRGININHIETAQQKTVVTSDSPTPIIAKPQPVINKSIEIKNESQLVTVENSVISKSAIAEDYAKDVKRTTKSTMHKSRALNEVKNLAQSDLNVIATEIKKQLKADLGADYDEELINQSINEAIEETLQSFADNKTNDANSFVYKRKGLFKRTYSYNVKNLADAFLASFNKINTEKYSQKLSNNVIKELKEKQEEYAEKYMRSIPSPLLYCFDKIYESALESINTHNYDEAAIAVEQYLQQKFTSVNGGDEADKLLSMTQDYYEMLFGGIYEDDNFSTFFEKAKTEVLDNIDDLNSCNTKDLVNSFDAQVRYLINDYMDVKLEQAASEPSVLTKNVSSDSIIATSSRDIPKEPSVKEINCKNGAVITITNYSFYYRNTSSVHTMRDKDGVHYPNATIDIMLPSGEKYSINVGIQNIKGPASQTPPISTIDKLAETLGSLKIDVLDSFCKEIHYVSIQDINEKYAGIYKSGETMGLTYRSEQRVGYSVNPEINNINGLVITHELGHAIDYNSHVRSQIKQFEDIFNEIKNNPDYKKFVKDEIYALHDVHEFFAEYYCYTKYSITPRQGQKLFKKLKQDAEKNPDLKNLFDSMDKIISDTEKLSKTERQATGAMSSYDLQAAKQRAYIEKTQAEKENTNNNQEGHKLPPLYISPETDQDNNNVFSEDIDDNYDEDSLIDDNWNSTDNSDNINNNQFDDNNVDNKPFENNPFESPSDNNQTDDIEHDHSNDNGTATETPKESTEDSLNDSNMQDNFDNQSDINNAPNDDSNEQTSNNNLDFPDNAIVHDDGNIIIPATPNDDTSNDINLPDIGPEHINSPHIVTDEEKQQLKEQYEEKYSDKYEVSVLNDGSIWLKPKEDKEQQTENSNNENNLPTDNNTHPDYSNNDTSDDTNIDVDDYFNDDGSFDTDNFIDDAIDSGWDHWEYDDPDDIEDIWGDIQDAEESNDWDNFWDDMYDDDDSWDSSWDESWDDSWDDSYDDDNWWDT